MKNMITEETVILYVICAIVYGLGYAIPDALGCHPLVSLLICMVAGYFVYMASERFLFSPFVQEKKGRKYYLFVVIILIYMIAAVLSQILMGYSLMEELGGEMIYMLLFAVLGFVVTMLRNFLAKKKIRNRYDESDDTYQFTEKEREYLNSLNAENKEITGKYKKENSVKTENGVFVGTVYKKLLYFCGIPYAKPPVGDLRWKAPVSPYPSEKVYEAAGFGASPIQLNLKGNPLSECRQSEDCLYLNVAAAPDKKEKKPVLVVVPGMDFATGGAMDPAVFGNAFLSAEPGTVVVSFNARLGLLGYIDFSGIPGGEEYPDARDLGFLDHIAALSWIKNNIAAFGGDPENVTVMGYGAGAVTISALSVCEQAKGLFRKAIILGESYKLVDHVKENAEFLAKRLLHSVGAESMEDLRRLSSNELSRQTQELSSYLCGLSVKEGLVPEDICGAYKEGKAGDIRFILGTAPDELPSFLSRIGEGPATQLKKNFQESLKTDLDPDVIRRTAAILKAAGSETREITWKIENEIEKLGAGSSLILAAFLGNLSIAESMGVIIPEDVSEVLQKFLGKFLRDEKMRFYNNEIVGFHELAWKESPDELVVTRKDITCEKSPL